MNQQENRQSATPSRLAALGNDHANRRRLPVHLQRSYGVRHLKLLSRRWHTYRALVSAICVIERFRCDRNWKVTQHHVLAIVALCLLLCASAAGNDLYSYVIVAQTNRSYDGVVFTTLGNAPSIADDGTVAFVGHRGDGTEAIYVSTPSGGITDITTPVGESSLTFRESAQINNNHQVVAYDKKGFGSKIHVWDTRVSIGPILVARGGSSSDDTYADVLEYPSINNSGQVVFSALPKTLTNRTVLVTPKTPPTSGFNEATFTGTGLGLKPMIDDEPLAAGNRIAVRVPAGSSTSVRLYANNVQTFTSIANAGLGFTQLGQSPGVSDDGSILVFTGIRGNGPGVFASIADGSGNRTTIRVAGENQGTGGPHSELGFNDTGGQSLYFDSFDLDARVAVIRSDIGDVGLKDDSIVVSFTATPNLASGPAGLNTPGNIVFSSNKGQWTVRLHAPSAFPSDITVTNPLPVIQLGDTLQTPAGPKVLDGISTYDPLAKNGSKGDHWLAFWATSGGDRLIVKASRISNPLVFIPGIGGSELREIDGSPSGTKRWPTISRNDINRLNLDTGASNVKATDIIRTAFVIKDIYQAALVHWTVNGYAEFGLGGDWTRLTSDYMLTQPFATRPTLFPFPYDWRKSVASHKADLHAYITHIRQLHGGAKVNIVGHSMGGLLLRSYILEFGSDDFENAVTVATPFWGAPKAINMMLQGDFFDIAIVDAVDNSAIRAAARTFTGVHELLPTNLYLQNGGNPVLSEDGYDLNNNHVAIEVYDSPKYWDLVDLITSPNTASQNNRAFHTVRQDDWSGDTDGLPYLHIYGQQTPDPETIIRVIAKERAYQQRNTPPRLQWFETLKGNGDHTVPLLSAQRLPQFLAPPVGTRTQTRVVTGKLEHAAIMGNTTVLSMIDSYLRGDPVPTAPIQALPAIPPPATQYIAIVGLGYVRIVDGLGNENTILSDIAAARIPGAEIQYGGDQPRVDITAGSGVELTIQGTPTDPGMEIEAIQFASDGTPSSLRRYRFDPLGHAWQAHIFPAGGADQVVSVDSNDNGTYEAGEQMPPSHSSGTGPVDTTRPFIDLNLSAVAGSIVVNLTAHDDMSPSPAIRYTINDGPVQNYLTPLNFTSGEGVVLKAFAEDDMGNTSGLITTSVRPNVSIHSQAGNAIVGWSLAEAYVLEEADDLAGPWTRSSAQVIRNAFTESATVPIETAPRKFFRLRSQTVTK